MRIPTIVIVRCSLLLLATAMTASTASSQVIVTISEDHTRLQGTAPDGRLLLFTPDPVQLGSSISHWDTSASPNLLMEPFISPDLGFRELDITPAMMQDIGWQHGTCELRIVPQDQGSGGFADPEAFSGAPGNDATTLGEARTNLINAILEVWEQTLHSNVRIDVAASWARLDCEEGEGAVLASAGTRFVYRDNAAFPEQGVWYHSALAESLAGRDLSGPQGDITVTINSAIDDGCLGSGTGFYYGLDGNPPSNKTDLVAVLLHELAHGLGMANVTNEETGELHRGVPAIYDVHTLDTVTGKTWDEMTDEERQASAVRYRKVVWTGEQANAAATSLLATGVRQLSIDQPTSTSAVFEIGEAQFGPSLGTISAITAEVACMIDDVAGEPEDATIYNGCTTPVNPGDLAGRIALVDRGDCTFVSKVANAQAAGAIAVVVVNLASDNPLIMGGSDAAITIPSVSIGRRDGERLRLVACPDTVSRPAPRRPGGRRSPG